MKTEPFKTKRHIKHKKVFQIYIIRRVGTGWELTNGSIKFSGPNRSDLFELMDAWETATRQQLRASKLGSPVKAKKSKKKKTKKRATS